MQVFLQIVAFSLQIIGSVWPVPTKGKRPKKGLKMLFPLHNSSSTLNNNARRPYNLGG